MAWKPNVAILALALASTALAGCIENPLSALRADTEVSAWENKDLADEAAADWNKDAQLIGVMAFELSESREERIIADPEVGNGLAPAWWYVYCAQTSEESAKAESKSGSSDANEEKAMATMSMVRAFKVTADGTVSSEDDAAAMASGFDHQMAGNIGNWKIDSIDALATAKADESFRKAAEGFNASVVEGVASHEGSTAWFFAAMSADGVVVAAIDAVNGELISVMPLDTSMQMPSFEWGARDPEMWTAEPVHLESEGVAEPGAEALQLPFTTVGEMHGTIMIDYDQMLPTDGLHWAILTPDGELVEGDHVRSWQGGSSYEMDLALEDAGDYVLSIEYMSWAPLPVGSPLSQGVAYTLMFDLLPGPAEEEETDG